MFRVRAAYGEVKESKRRLNEAVGALRSIAVKSPEAGDAAEEWESKPAELERVARITGFLKASG